MNNVYKLGRPIAQKLPFQRIPIKKQQKVDITTKVLIAIIVVAIVNIAVLILWRFRKSIS